MRAAPQSVGAAMQGKEPLFTLSKTLDAAGTRFARFRAPSGTLQGRPHWYAIKARLRIRMNQNAANGSVADVLVLTDHHTDFMVHIVSGRLDGLPAVRWSSDDLFVGPAAGLVLRRTLELTARNYVEAQGIHGGANSMSILLRQGTSGPVRTALLLPGSTVTGRIRPPPRLILNVWTRQPRARVGDVIRVRYQIQSLGVPAREVSVWSNWDGQGMAPVDIPSRFFGWAAREQGQMSFLALHAGRYKIDIDTGGRTGNLAAKVLTIQVAPRGSA